MKRIVVAGAVVAFLLSASGASATQIERLQAKNQRLEHEVKVLRNQREGARVARDAAVAAVAQGLSSQVATVAQNGSILQLWSSVLDPVRAYWPCGASVFQGQTLWSIDLWLSDYDAADRTIQCGG